MSKQLIEFTTDKRFVRRVRELKTIEIMVRIYCRHHHGDTPLRLQRFLYRNSRGVARHRATSKKLLARRKWAPSSNAAIVKRPMRTDI